jgi:hypothetical protein
MAEQLARLCITAEVGFVGIVYRWFFGEVFGVGGVSLEAGLVMLETADRLVTEAIRVGLKIEAIPLFNKI